MSQRPLKPRRRACDAGAFLSRSELLRGASPEALAFLVRAACALHARSDQLVFGERDEAPGVFIVASGHVALAVAHGAEARVVELCGPGESFGEEALMAGAAAASARAVSRSLLIHVPRAPMLQAMARDGALCARVLASVSRRLGRATRLLGVATSRSAAQRLIAYLLHHLPAGTATPARLVLPVPKRVLASFLGVSKETLSRLLARLAETQLVAVRGREIRIPDPARLVAACHADAPCARCEGCPHAVAPPPI